MRIKRKKVWIDRFQTYLCLRLSILFASYQAAVWLFFIVSRALMINLGSLLGGPLTYWLVSLAGCLVLICLLFLYDMMKFSHRLVGPLVRFRKVVKAITAGEEIDLMGLRKDDFLQELKDEVNEMLRALEQRGAVVLKNPQTKTDPQPSLSV